MSSESIIINELSFNNEKTEFFVQNIIRWNDTIDRDMPWTKTSDPYKIWLSEIILQQTRVDQGKPYYLNFVEKYPTVFDLAQAQLDDIYALWKGLGYYNRARNLYASAKEIAECYNGVFPNEYEKILGLKGIGTYTAAAIASFAFELPYAVVDGNVFRVLSRYWGLVWDISANANKKHFQDLSSFMLLDNKSSLYNQAIMNFGAIQCGPKPKCADCPLQSNCTAFDKKLVSQLPVKSKKIKKSTKYFNYLIITDEKNRVYLSKRNDNGIWQNLYEPLLLETDKRINAQSVCSFVEETYGIKASISKKSEEYIQQLTHLTVKSQFWMIDKPIIDLEKNTKCYFSIEEIKKIGLSKTVDWFFSNKFLNLDD